MVGTERSFVEISFTQSPRCDQFQLMGLLIDQSQAAPLDSQCGHGTFDQSIKSGLQGRG